MIDKTYGKIDELAAVDTVSQQRAIGTLADDRTIRYERGIEHGRKGGFVAGQLAVLKTMGELANELQASFPSQADSLRIVARQILATLQPKRRD